MTVEGDKMVRDVFILDLQSIDAAAEYEEWHRPGHVPEAVLDDIRASHIGVMEIYRSGDRLVMITETSGEQPPQKREMSEQSRAWELLMNKYQKPVPWAEANIKWQPAALIFDLSEHHSTSDSS